MRLPRGQPTQPRTWGHQWIQGLPFDFLPSFATLPFGIPSQTANSCEPILEPVMLLWLGHGPHTGHKVWELVNS